MDHYAMYVNLLSLTDSIRFDVYKHVLQIKDGYNLEVSALLEDENDPAKQVKNDSELVKMIFEGCMARKQQNNEVIFKVYKMISRQYPIPRKKEGEENDTEINSNLLDIIFKLTGLPNSDEWGVYWIITRLIEKYGLLMAIGHSEKDSSMLV